MGYESDPYMDESGEPLMDPDMPSDRERSTEPMDRIDDDDDGDWRRERSPTLVLDSTAEGKNGKPRKRLVKISAVESSSYRGWSPTAAGLVDWEEEDPSERKRKKAPSSKERKGGSGGKEKKRKSSSSKVEQSAGKRFKSGSKGYRGGPNGQAGDPEMELWDTIAGADSEDDQEGVRTVDDDNFIDDGGVDPADRFGSDKEGGSAEVGEEDDKISKLFKGGKRNKKNEKSPAELAIIVEHLLAELEVTAEEDVELNRKNKLAVNKLKKLPLLVEVLSKKKLQQEFLDHGVLTLLKNWLEPLPDGCLPNMNIRTAIPKILADFPIDLEQYDRREQVKKSGLGKVMMFLSKSDEETRSNRKLAKELVDKWSRPIFNKSTRFEDMRSFDDERIPYKRPSSQKLVNKAIGLESRDDGLDLAEFSRGWKSGQAASRPEAMPLDFVMRPQSKIDPEEVRARVEQSAQNQQRLKMNKKLQQLKAPKRRQLQASKVCIEGCGMVKYL